MVKIPLSARLSETKTDVVVPVAVRRAKVPRFVVPGTTADHALVASRLYHCERRIRNLPDVIWLLHFAD